MAKLIGGAEVYFAKKLANNDVKVRNRALKRLKAWLSKKTETVDCAITNEDFLKIWKGLFYCMWYSDSYLVQESLAESISDLLYCFKDQNIGMMYVKTFFDEMGREWLGIDRLRLDKFYLLVKNMLFSTLEYVGKGGWMKNSLSLFSNNLESFILSKSYPDGLKIFLAEKILEAVQITYQKNRNINFLSGKQILFLLKPFINYFMHADCEAVSKAVEQDILELLPTIKVIRYDETTKKKKKLAFPLEEVSQYLFETGSKQEVNTKNRKTLFSFVEKYQGLGKISNYNKNISQTRKRKKGKKNSQATDETQTKDKPLKKKKMVKKNEDRYEHITECKEEVNSNDSDANNKEFVIPYDGNDTDFGKDMAVEQRDLIKPDVKKHPKNLSENKGNSDNRLKPIEFVKTTPKATFFKKSTSKALSEPKVRNKVQIMKQRPNSGKRKVKIELSKNIAISQKELKISPLPAFSPTKKPNKSALKTPIRHITIQKRPSAADFF